MTIHHVDQRSEEWQRVRVGKCTASRIADVVAKTKSGWGASRANYRAQLIVERLTGAPSQSYTSEAMQYGIDNEAEAIAAYEFRTDAAVQPVGFVDHPFIAMSGASPDGLVGDTGLVEVKVPNSATHIDTLLSGTVPDKYIKQIQFQMACHESTKWCDFVSYDPRMPEAMRLFIKRIPRDDKEIKLLERSVVEFLAELDDKINALRSRYALTEQLAASVAAA